MAIWSNVARIDVREALLRPDLVPLGERGSSWYVQLPTTLASGEPVPATGRWTLTREQGLALTSTGDPVVRGLLALYDRARTQAERAAPHDPNFTGPLEVIWRRLTPAEASARPFDGAYCLDLSGDGSLGQSAGFTLSSHEVAERALSAPSPPPEHALITTLRAYGARQASNVQVMRAIMEHRDWFAPVWALTTGGEKQLAVPGMVLYGQESRMPPDVLWLFSSRTRADQANAQLEAQGGQLGPYVAGVSGVDVCKGLAQASFEKLNVNIGSKQVEETFFVGDRPGQLLWLWAMAVGAEQALASAPRSDDPQALRALRDQPALGVFQSPTQGLLKIEHEGRKGIPIFTAIDCAEAFAATLPYETRSAFARTSAPGTTVFEVLERINPDAIFINPGGPGVQRTLDGRAASVALTLG